MRAIRLVVAASVVACDGALADALATALCVVDASAAEELCASREGCEARVVRFGAGGATEWETAGFRPLVVPPQRQVWCQKQDQVRSGFELDPD